MNRYVDSFQSFWARFSPCAAYIDIYYFFKLQYKKNLIMTYTLFLRCWLLAYISFACEIRRFISLSEFKHEIFFSVYKLTIYYSIIYILLGTYWNDCIQWCNMQIIYFNLDILFGKVTANTGDYNLYYTSSYPYSDYYNNV